MGYFNQAEQALSSALKLYDQALAAYKVLQNGDRKLLVEAVACLEKALKS